MINYKAPELKLDTTITKTVKLQSGIGRAYSSSGTCKVVIEVSVGRTKISHIYDNIGTNSISSAEASARAQMRHWLQGLTGNLTKQRFYVQSVDLKKTGLDPSAAKVTFSAEQPVVDKLIIDVEGAGSVEEAEARMWRELAVAEGGSV